MWRSVGVESSKHREGSRVGKREWKTRKKQCEGERDMRKCAREREREREETSSTRWEGETVERSKEKKIKKKNSLTKKA